MCILRVCRIGPLCVSRTGPLCNLQVCRTGGGDPGVGRVDPRFGIRKIGCRTSWDRVYPGLDRVRTGLPRFRTGLPLLGRVYPGFGRGGDATVDAVLRARSAKSDETASKAIVLDGTRILMPIDTVLRERRGVRARKEKICACRIGRFRTGLRFND